MYMSFNLNQVFFKNTSIYKPNNKNYSNIICMYIASLDWSFLYYNQARKCTHKQHNFIVFIGELI